MANHIFHILKTNSMKSIFTIILFFIGSFYMNVSGQYNLVDPKLIATGRLEPELFFGVYQGTSFETYSTKYSTIQPQYRRVVYERRTNNNWIVEARTIFNAPTSNCSQPYSIGSTDSIIYVNGRRSEVIQYQEGANSQRVVDQRNKYYYNNNGQLDSLQIKSLNPGDIFEFVYRFSYDAKGRMTYTSSDGTRRYFEYDANGNISRFLEEGYDTNLKKWVTYWNYDFTWSAGKIMTIKTLEDDSIRFTFNYTPNTTVVQNITGERKRIGASWVQVSDLILKTKNAKNYPTRLDYKVLNTTTSMLEDESIYEYSYYPNDTLIYQRTFNKAGRITYEYCGIPSLTPISELQTLDFKIYPNPTNQVINIEIPENIAFNNIPNTFGTEGASIEIFNAMGIMVSKAKQLAIDVSGLPTGVYFAHVKTKDRVGVQRFLVNK
jgi:hypothetical protein